MDLAHWVNLPLQVSDQLLGSLGLGLSPARTAPDEQLPFLQALAERAARGFANTQLISELRRTRERLERILGVLAEAVTVHDERGKLVYANAAAVTLLGAESVEELLAAEPGELAGRFIITREDGTPVQESTCRASGCWRARTRRRCSPAASCAEPGASTGCSPRPRGSTTPARSR